MADETPEIPTIDTLDEAVALLAKLRKTTDWVSVFWDRGWGDSGQVAEISIITTGNGQKPHAWISAAVYRALRDQEVIERNSLRTYKARRVHNYQSPPVDHASVAKEQAEHAARWDALHAAVKANEAWSIPANGGTVPTAQRFTVIEPYFGGDMGKPWAGVCGNGRGEWDWWAKGADGAEITSGQVRNPADAITLADSALTAWLATTSN